MQTQYEREYCALMREIFFKSGMTAYDLFDRKQIQNSRDFDARLAKKWRENL